MKRSRILIVEDDSIIAADIEEALTGLNYDVVGIAASANDAYRIAQNHKLDLVLMDINIEGNVDGIEAARHLTAQYDFPVVFLTAFADLATFTRAKNLEPQGYVLKPFRQMELKTVIDLALHRHEQEGKRRAEAASPVIEKTPLPPTNFHLITRLPRETTTQSRMAARATLSAMDPFAGLPEPLIEEIAAVAPMSSFRNFDVIVHEGSDQRFGFIVLTGRVAVSKRSPGGKELALDLIGKEDLFSLISLMDDQPCPFSARSQGDSTVMWIPREVMRYLAEHCPEVKTKMMKTVIERLRQAQDLSRALAHDKVETRIANALVALGDRFGARSEGDSAVKQLSLTRSELAELVGTTPETISRVFARFVDDGAIDITKPGLVVIQSQDYLMKLVNPV